eukprot:c21411_g1_i1 orf=461-2620(-)
MADDSRSPNSCPWDPGEVCKASNGACLPPRKRLLADLRQNGWLSSSSPYLQSCNGAPCAGLMEELKLEVDLGEANHECNGDTCLVESSADKQGECNAVEHSGFVKSKKTRRKSLSVLADCHSSAKNLQPEVLKSFPGSKIQKKFRSNKASKEFLLASNKEKESVSSYREMVDAARARAAKAAKAAAEAKAIALDKAAAAAKAATVAKAALEAVALAVYDEEWELQFSNHVPASCRQRRKQEVEPKARFVPLCLNGGVIDLSEKRKEDDRTQIGSAGLDRSKEDEWTQVGQASAVTFSSVSDGALVDKIKADGPTKAGQNPLIDLATARAGAPLHKSKEDEQTSFNQICTVACPPPPPPVDDEKLARQLHRDMNSSPRISRNRAPSECLKKSETSPSSTQGCTRNKYQRAGGCSLSREKKQIPKVKLRDLRTSIGRADVKVKSMSAINETLNLLQGASSSQYRVLGGMVSCCAASNEYRDNICVKEGASTPVISSHAFAPLTKCNEESHRLTVNCDGARSCRFDTEASNSAHFSTHIHEPDAMRMNDKSRAMGSARMIRKLKFSSKKGTEGAERIEVSPQSRDSNGIYEMPTMRAENQSTRFSIAATELIGSHPETSSDLDGADRDENQGRVSVLDLGIAPQVAGSGVKEMHTIENFQENSFSEKSSGATRKNPPLPLHGERQTRRQKILGVLSNGSSKGNQNFGESMNLSSYMPSPPVS